jgi:hypothetical protein
MICPKCHAEYREGFYRCVECDVPLISETDTEMDFADAEDSSLPELQPVFETQDSSFLSDLVALVEENKIPYILQSGTAIGRDSLEQSDALEWRAVLYVPNQLEEMVESFIAKLKSDRSKEPEANPDAE